MYDANGNGHIEDGEGIADIRLVLPDYSTHTIVAKATSDAPGRFAFAGIPTGLSNLTTVRQY